jgi:hypothetical protein
MSSPREPIERRVERSLQSRSLDIVMFGPGRSNEAGWRLREAIRAELVRQHPTDTVEFPEEIIERSAVLRDLARSRLALAELAIIRECDAVIALLIEDSLASGVLVELGQFLIERDLRDRFLVLIPIGLRDLVTGPRVPYAFQILQVLHPERLIWYTPGQADGFASLLGEISKRLVVIRSERSLQ